MKQKNILFFTTHKAASMFIFRLCNTLTKLKGIDVYSIHKKNSPYFFDSERGTSSNKELWETTERCFAPLRLYIPIPSINSVNIVLHLRDPRDVLVSQFYSHAYSHQLTDGKEKFPIPRREALEIGIDKYVFKEADKFHKTYENYIDNLLGKENVIFVKYEEMITDFRSWLSKVIVPFNLDNQDKIIEMLCTKYKDEFKIRNKFFRLFKSDKYHHKRQIVPGDYKDKLQPETISILNEKFLNILNKLEYQV